MKIKYLFLIALFLGACGEQQKEPNLLQSPNGNLKIEILELDMGKIAYIVNYKNNRVIDTSFFSFEFKSMPVLSNDLKIVATKANSVNESWEMPWGEQKIVENNYNELILNISEQNKNARKFILHFKAYDDGLGFRYEFPEQENMKDIIITDEKTEFKLTGNHTCWWIPGDWDIYEHLYTTCKFNKIDALKYKDNGLAQTYIPYNAVSTPVTMKTDNGLYLSFHEANLINYPGMTLMINKENLKMTSELVGNDAGIKAKLTVPFVTPWRTIQISDVAGDLIESNLIENLCEPNKIGDVSWFKPTKYLGIWWDMHVGTAQWSYTNDENYKELDKVKPHGMHGATTEYAKELIDFAAENNIGALLVEGWNTGWEHWIGFDDREGVFDFVTPYPDYNLKDVVKYAKNKDVEIIMHHETSAAPRTYEQQIDTAYRLMQSLGIHAVKTGYVGKIIPKGEYHHGQWMVNHYNKVMQTAAKYQIAVNVHEPIKQTGLRRTYPNLIAAEGLRGQEFNAWAGDGGNPPEHLTNVAFARMLAGPIDFTPGIFNIKLEPYRENNQINTTLAHQLALYVVIYSPIQMAADLIKHYKDNDAFQFIRDVAVDWEQSIVINGEPGDYLTIARKQRDSDNWFIGSITDENKRKLECELSFLDKDKKYIATIYRDANDAHWNNNPTAYKIEEMEVDKSTVLNFNLVEGGGVAVYIKSNP